MTRFTRTLFPASLCALLTGAIILACGSHGSPGEAPATPRPEATTPSGQPMQDPGSGAGTPGERDAGSGASTVPRTSPSPGQPLSLGVGGAGAAGLEVLLASQPASPSPTTPPPGAAPSRPGGPSPTTPSQPGAPQPGSPSPTTPPPGAAPPQPGSPSKPGSPSQPGSPSRPGAPQPGSPSQPSSPTPPTTAASDAGVSDAYSPPMPPVPDAGVPSDSAMQPILRRD